MSSKDSWIRIDLDEFLDNSELPDNDLWAIESGVEKAKDLSSDLMDPLEFYRTEDGKYIMSLKDNVRERLLSDPKLRSVPIAQTFLRLDNMEY